MYEGRENKVQRSIGVYRRKKRAQQAADKDVKICNQIWTFPRR